MKELLRCVQLLSRMKKLLSPLGSVSEERLGKGHFVVGDKEPVVDFNSAGIHWKGITTIYKLPWRFLDAWDTACDTGL